MHLKTYMTYSVIFIATLIAPIIFAATQPIITKNSILYPDRNYTQVSQTPVAIAQKCGPIFAIQNMEGMLQQIPENYKGEIPSSPGLIPTFGYVGNQPLEKEQITFLPPETPYIPEETMLATMWNHDIIVIWYDPEKTTEIEYDLYKELGEKNVGGLLILPWMEYESVGSLPMGRSVAFATIGHTQSCEGANINVLNDFRSYTLDNRNYELGTKIPEAQTTKNNKLEMITID
jgi:hypothetical protein